MDWMMPPYVMIRTRIPLPLVRVYRSTVPSLVAPHALRTATTRSYSASNVCQFVREPPLPMRSPSAGQDVEVDLRVERVAGQQVSGPLARGVDHRLRHVELRLAHAAGLRVVARGDFRQHR